jgi:protein arginine N-methyltransferase 1
MDNASQSHFKQALQKNIRPGDVVLDLGTGSGLHSLFACQAGAKKVYAIDCEPIIEVAKETARANGFGDRIEFIYDLAENVILPEKVDVIITNIGFLNTLQVLPEMVRRHLRPGGKVIPSGLELQFALVDAPEQHREKVGFWDQEKFGFDFTAFKTMASNHPLYTVYDPDQLLSEGQSLGRLDMLNTEQDWMEKEIVLTPLRDGLAHGLAGWYRFWAGEDLLMSTEPPLKLDKEIWTQILLPFEKPLLFKKDEPVTFRIGMYARGGANGPFWRWQAWRGQQLIVDQCSFFATPLNKTILEKLEH